MKEKKAFVFFNCDEEKSQTSMNVFYNSTFYSETKKARKELLAKVDEELKEGRIQIAEENKAKVDAAIMEGEPENASQYITYGTIAAFTII
jgi:hypothetical protein